MKDFFDQHNTTKDYKTFANYKVYPFKNKLALIWFIYFAMIVGISLLESIISGDGTLDFGITSNGTLSTSSSLSSVLSMFLSGSFMFSFIIISEKVCFGYEPNLKDLFSGFRFYGRSLGIYLLTQLYVTLWSFLLFIPGIIKSYSYSMAPYIALHNPELSLNQCITKSRELMDGHKADLFHLHLSYFGWILLCVLTCGILTFWVAPKIQTAQYLFYLDISGKGKKIYNKQTEFCE